MDILEGLSRPIVADIGSGANPFPLANLLVDLYPDDNRHRANNAALFRDGRRFIQADVEDLPFPDGSIDFVWCRDVLEHCPNPGKALQELMRVGKRLFVFCPTMSREMAMSQKDPKGWATHLWYIVRDGKKLRIINKQDYDMEGQGTLIGNSEYVMIEHGKEGGICGDLSLEGPDLSVPISATCSLSEVGK